MNERARATTASPGVLRRACETLLFITASAVGIYGIGRGLAGFYEPSQQYSLIWLAAAGVAVFVLFAQMGRVHDTWPHKPGKAAPASSETPSEAPSEELSAIGLFAGEPQDRGGK